MDLDHLMLRVLVFVDRNGTVISKTSNPMLSSLRMKYNCPDPSLNIEMHAYAHCQGNGSCSAKVEYDGEVVFDASGMFMTAPHKVAAKVYVSGTWERLIPEVE